MNLNVTTRLLSAAALASAVAFTVACSGPSSSLNPTSPSAMSASTAASGANFGINPDCELHPDDPNCPKPPPPPNCDTDPTLPGCEPPPPPPGTPCSPGYWKNHATAFNTYCAAAAALGGDPFTTCGQLMTALTCRGSDASCGRHLAAAALNSVSACTESD